jgi:hypothetical protein
MPVLNPSELNIVVSVAGKHWINSMAVSMLLVRSEPLILSQVASCSRTASSQSSLNKHGTLAKPVCELKPCFVVEAVLFADQLQVPAMLFGIILGPIAGRLLQTEKWGTATEGQTRDITLVCQSKERDRVRVRTTY